MKYLVALLVVLMASTAFAATDVRFRWQANTEPDLAGYRMFRSGISGQYDYNNPVADIACGPNDTTCTNGIDPGVPDGGPYFWVLRAYDTEGHESIDSNEQTKDRLDSTPPDQPQGFSFWEFISKVYNYLKGFWGKGFRVAA